MKMSMMLTIGIIFACLRDVCACGIAHSGFCKEHTCIETGFFGNSTLQEAHDQMLPLRPPAGTRPPVPPALRGRGWSPTQKPNAATSLPAFPPPSAMDNRSSVLVMDDFVTSAERSTLLAQRPGNVSAFFCQDVNLDQCNFKFHFYDPISLKARMLEALPSKLHVITTGEFALLDGMLTRRSNLAHLEHASAGSGAAITNGIREGSMIALLYLAGSGTLRVFPRSPSNATTGGVNEYHVRIQPGRLIAFEHDRFEHSVDADLGVPRILLQVLTGMEQ